MSKIGAAPWLTAKPASPSQWDDEFEGMGLDINWTRITNGVVPKATTPDVKWFDPYNQHGAHQESMRQRPGWYCRQPCLNYGINGYGLTTEGITKSLVGLPTNCFIWIRAGRTDRAASNTDGDGEVWMTLYNAAAPVNSAYIGMNSFSNQPGIVYARTTAAIPAFTQLGEVQRYFNKGNPAEYIGILKIGNVYHGYTATHSGNWVWLDSITMAVDLDSVTLSFNNGINNPPGGMMMYVDFFRVTPGKILP